MQASPVEVMVDLIDDRREAYGVEPICGVQTTMIVDEASHRPADLVKRDFTARPPANQP